MYHINIPFTVNDLKKFQKELGAFLKPLAQKIETLKSSDYTNGGEYYPQKFIAWTRNNCVGLGETRGKHLYLNDKREDIFNDPIAYWFPIT